MLDSGSFAYAASGAVLNNTLDSGGVDLVAGMASGTTVSNGGTELVLGGGSTVSAAIFSGGVESVEGTASATTVSNGGYEFVAAGGSADGTIIDSGGFVYVASGGSISGVTISDGTLDLTSGAVVTSGALAVTFSSGGELILNDAVHFGGLVAGFSGTDSMDLVNIPYVTSGGSGSQTTVSWMQPTSSANASGTLTVSEGGSTANITLLGQYVAGNFSIQRCIAANRRLSVFVRRLEPLLSSSNEPEPRSITSWRIHEFLPVVRRELPLCPIDCLGPSVDQSVQAG